VRRKLICRHPKFGTSGPHSRDRDHVGLHVGKFGNSGEAAEIKRDRHGIIQSRQKFGEERKRERERKELASGSFYLLTLALSIKRKVRNEGPFNLAALLSPARLTRSKNSQYACDLGREACFKIRDVRRRRRTRRSISPAYTAMCNFAEEFPVARKSVKGGNRKMA